MGNRASLSNCFFLGKKKRWGFLSMPNSGRNRKSILQILQDKMQRVRRQLKVEGSSVEDVSGFEEDLYKRMRLQLWKGQ